MAQYCPKCKWYSADGLTHCSTCGAPFEEEIEDETREEEALGSSLTERIGWSLAIGVGAVAAVVALYGRYGTAERIGAVTSGLNQAAAAVREFAQAAYRWLIGPQGEYKDFVAIALVGSLFVWIVLWALARLRR